MVSDSMPSSTSLYVACRAASTHTDLSARVHWRLCQAHSRTRGFFPTQGLLRGRVLEGYVRVNRLVVPANHQTRSIPLSHTSKVWVPNFHALTLVYKVSIPAVVLGLSNRLANFKEAGEAKENYDLRTIFDNT